MERPDAEDFTTEIDNPNFLLRPGTTYVYENRDEGETVEVEVTDETVVVDGVTCVVVHDIARKNGQIVEDTFDWYAQDSDGNVWYFGEDSHEFEPGDPDPVSAAGSWTAGIDGAEAGIIMLAEPEVGEAYQQENAPGIAEDWAQVAGIGEHVDTVYMSSDDALRTYDVNPFDPSIENKIYVPGVGLVLTLSPEGDREQLTKIIVNGTSGADRLQGYAGGDEMNGGAGKDKIWACEGNDNIKAGAGDDAINAGRGFDRIDGGSGSDIMRGFLGGDTFVFRHLSDGVADIDTIKDYRRGQVDVLDIQGGAAAIVSDAFVGGAWELSLAGDSDIIRLLNVNDANGNGHITDELIFA